MTIYILDVDSISWNIVRLNLFFIYLCRTITSCLLKTASMEKCKVFLHHDSTPFCVFWQPYPNFFIKYMYFLRSVWITENFYEPKCSSSYHSFSNIQTMYLLRSHQTQIPYDISTQTHKKKFSQIDSSEKQNDKI